MYANNQRGEVGQKRIKEKKIKLERERNGQEEQKNSPLLMDQLMELFVDILMEFFVNLLMDLLMRIKIDLSEERA